MDKSELMKYFIRSQKGFYFEKIMSTLGQKFADCVKIGNFIVESINSGKIKSTSSSSESTQLELVEGAKRLRAVNLLRSELGKIPNPLPKRFDETKRCAFHSGVLGHDTEDCNWLRHRIERLIKVIIMLKEARVKYLTTFHQKLNITSRSQARKPAPPSRPQQDQTPPYLSLFLPCLAGVDRRRAGLKLLMTISGHHSFTFLFFLYLCCCFSSVKSSGEVFPRRFAANSAQKTRCSESEKALHNTDEDLSKVITLYVPPSRATYPTGINYEDVATIDTYDQQGNIDSQCYISDNDIAAISQVPMCKTNLKYVRKLTSKRNRKGKDEYYLAKHADLKPTLDFVVAQPAKKSWFYYMAQSSNCWNYEHIDMVFYYLRKKAKMDTTSEYKYTIVNCVFINYIHDTYTHYHRSNSEIDLSSHVENIRSMKLASVERSICEIMQGLCILAGIPWHLIDEVYAPVNCKGSFHWVLAVIVLKERCIRVYDSMKDHRGHADEIKELAEMDSLFVEAYAEFSSDRHQIPSSEFDSKKHRTRYASLLWDYGVNKACPGYVSDNQDPPNAPSFDLRIQR
ncbi:hypothetical protein FXO37_31503 [Capsicum annuum]|nr:hypothetical protein FXO37_31503 [Capsicum annuum]